MAYMRKLYLRSQYTGKTRDPCCVVMNVPGLTNVVTRLYNFEKSTKPPRAAV